MPQDFTAYKIRQARLSYPGPHASVADLCVTGYDAEAKAAIQACCGSDIIRIQWSMNDCALDIMSRAESLLRIPMRHWRLATEGALLDPGDSDPLGWYPPFKGCNCVDLVLVPIRKIEDYVTMFASQSLHPIWKHLKPNSTYAVGSHDNLQQATALYHLIHPLASAQWQRYVQLRKAAEAEFFGTLRTTRHLSKLHPVMTQIREGLTFVLEHTGLKGKHQLSLADGIIPLTLNVTRSKNVTDVEVYSRIHSATKPAAVDISYIYRHCVHQNRAEFYCHIYFRISDPIMSAKHVRPSAHAHHWERLFEMGTYCDSDDSPPRRKWHPIVQTEWSLEPSQVSRIRAALFGAEQQYPAKAVDKVDTVRLLLASVGIPYRVATTEDEEDAQEPRFARAIFWEWEDDDWIGLNVRRACKEPLMRDATWTRSARLRSPDDDDISEIAMKKWHLSEDGLGEDYDAQCAYSSEGSEGSEDKPDRSHDSSRNSTETLFIR